MTDDDFFTIPPLLRRTPGDRGAQSAQEARNAVEGHQSTPPEAHDEPAPPPGRLRGHDDMERRRHIGEREDD